ncbi:UNVERIFIED_CONTAM: hypothetical protein FKN15_055092 [Acipenser sinensis]
MTEFFNSASLQCSACGANQIHSSDGLQCVCKDGYTVTDVGSPIVECAACAYNNLTACQLLTNMVILSFNALDSRAYNLYKKALATSVVYQPISSPGNEPPFKLTVQYTTVDINGQPNSQAQIALAVLGGLSIFLAMLETSSWSHRAGQQFINCTTIIKYLAFLTGNVANTLFLITIGTGIYWLVAFKGQHTAVDVALPSPGGNLETDFIIYLSLAFAFKDNLCALRGLEPSSEIQTFDFLLTQKFRDQLDKIVRPLSKVHEDMDYMVKDKLFLEKIMNYEFQQPFERSMFYNDPDGIVFSSVLYYGNELVLLLFDTLLFCIIDLGTQNIVLATVLTYLVQQLLEMLRYYIARNNLTKKTLVDQCFLI